VDIFRRYKLVIKIIHGTVLNKLQSYNRISALGPEGLAVSRECCVFHVDRMWTSTWGVGGLAHVDACGQGEGVKNPTFCGYHKWMAPYNCNRWNFIFRYSILGTVSCL